MALYRHLIIAIKLTLLATLLLGLAYPLLMTAVCHALFPRQANGSLVTVHGRVVGSELIGQPFAAPGYFHPRPSAAGSGYDPTASGGSNLGPTSRTLISRIARDLQTLRGQNPTLNEGGIPVDMVTTSASGLDPHISPANAYAQVARVAKARGMSEDSVKALLASHMTDRQFGLLGEPRVNVLTLNLALDEAMRRP